MANVFGGGSGASCGDSGISRVLPTSPEALQNSQAQAFSSSPNVFSKTKKGVDGLNLRDFYTKSEIQKLLKLKADISSVYTDDETDQLLVDLRGDIAADLVSFITEPEVDQKISDSYISVLAYLGANYYDRTTLYTKYEVDNLLSGLDGVATDSFVLKQPVSTQDNTVSPGSNAAIPLTLVASSNTNITTVQQWIDPQSNSIGRVRSSGRVEFYGYMNLGENIEAWRPALDVNERRISGLADPVHSLDAVNKKFMQDYITETIDNVVQVDDNNYVIDALVY